MGYPSAVLTCQEGVESGLQIPTCCNVAESLQDCQPKSLSATLGSWEEVTCLIHFGLSACRYDVASYLLLSQGFAAVQCLWAR